MAAAGLFEGYDPGGFFDEVVDGDGARVVRARDPLRHARVLPRVFDDHVVGPVNYGLSLWSCARATCGRTSTTGPTSCTGS